MGTRKCVFQQLPTGQSPKQRLVCKSCWWEELTLKHKSGANEHLEVSMGYRKSKITVDHPAGPKSQLLIEQLRFREIARSREIYPGLRKKTYVHWKDVLKGW